MIIFLVEESPEGGFTARAFGEAIFTEAESIDELHEMVRDAVRCHFEEGKAPGAGDGKCLLLNRSIAISPRR